MATPRPTPAMTGPPGFTAWGPPLWCTCMSASGTGVTCMGGLQARKSRLAGRKRAPRLSVITAESSKAKDQVGAELDEAASARMVGAG